MQHQKTWTITEFREGESNEVLTGASHAEALIALRRAMHGDAGSLLSANEPPVDELSLAA